MKKRGAILFIMVVALALLGCEKPQSNVTTPQPEKFKVGLIIPLTGTVADYGQAIANSIKLAIDENPDGFKHLELIYEDAQYDNTKAVMAFHKLVNQDKVDLIYTFGISFCQALSPLAESYRMPTILQCIDPNSAKGKQYSIRFMNYTDQYLKLQNDYLHEHGAKKIGIVITDNAYLEEMHKALQRTKYPDQEITVIDNYSPSDMTFKTTIAKAKIAQYDAIGVYLGAGQIPQFFKEAKQLQLNTPLFGTNWFESPSEILASNGTMDGAIFVNNYVKPEYVSKYKARYGNEGQLAFGSLAYEAFRLIAENSQRLLANNQKLQNVEAILSSTGHNWLATNPGEYKNLPEVGKFFDFPLAIKQIKIDPAGNISFEILETR